MSADFASTLGPARSDEQTLPQDLTNSLVQLLHLARVNLEVDRRAAELSIARATSLLRIEIERNASGAVEAADAGTLAGWQIHRVKSYVDGHLDAPIQIRDLAAVARRSSGYFCRAFKRSVGETPHAFIIGRRLHRARELMLTTDTSLAQIAIACGFSDQAHLCKLFRSGYGQSPAAWRRERRERGQGPALRSPGGEPNPCGALAERAES
jgi:AraC family transcriptional regulator